MNRLVVDASVAAKWYLPEVHSREALSILTEDFQFLVPDLFYAEMGNLLWKRVMREEITPAKGLEILVALDSVPLQIWESRTLMPMAFDIACQTKVTLYDSLYLALAVSTKSRMITADQKLFNALKNESLGGRLIWIGDLK